MTPQHPAKWHPSIKITIFSITTPSVTIRNINTQNTGTQYLACLYWVSLCCHLGRVSHFSLLCWVTLCWMSLFLTSWHRHDCATTLSITTLRITTLNAIMLSVAFYFMLFWVSLCWMSSYRVLWRRIGQLSTNLFFIQRFDCNGSCTSSQRRSGRPRGAAPGDAWRRWSWSGWRRSPASSAPSPPLASKGGHCQPRPENLRPHSQHFIFFEIYQLDQ